MEPTNRFPTPIWGNSVRRADFTLYEGLRWREKYGGFHVPDFQRGLVWTQEQKVLFIESMYLELPIGSYTYHQEEPKGSELPIRSMLDGQQRWSAIYGYVDNEFPVYGLFWRDLTEVERRKFCNKVFPCQIVSDLTYEAQREIFERLAYGGTPNVRPEGQEGH